MYTELNVPVLDSLELSAAVRHDKYSDFGSTTNPKYSFRYQPIKELVVRGAYSEGFRAPSLYELYNPQYTTYTQGYYNDPRLCTGGVVQPGGNAGRDCGQQFHNRTGGNTELSPEKARNVTVGFVYQPVRNLSMGLDFWWIHIANQIAEFPESTVFDDPNAYADRYIRNADGSLNYVQTGLANLGAVKTSGVDVSLDYKFPNTPTVSSALACKAPMCRAMTTRPPSAAAIPTKSARSRMTVWSRAGSTCSAVPGIWALTGHRWSTASPAAMTMPILTPTPV